MLNDFYNLKMIFFDKICIRIKKEKQMSYRL